MTYIKSIKAVPSVFRKIYKNLAIVLFIFLVFGMCNPTYALSKKVEKKPLVSKVEKEIIIALIDTGVDTNHEMLKDKLWTNEKEIPGDGIDNDKNGYIDDIHGWNFYSNQASLVNYNNTYDDHGTHIAGIIGLNTEENVKIMNLKVLGGKNRTGNIKSLIKAIEYAQEQGASICNISLGTTYNDKNLKKAIKNSNMLFVVAAGNGTKGINIDKTPIYPASYTYNNIISVANYEGLDQLHSSSNYGKKNVDIAGYGTNIYSTLTNGQYGYMTGTSMATGYISSLIANLYGQNPSFELTEIKDLVIKEGVEISSLKNKITSSKVIKKGKEFTNYFIKY